MVDIAKIKAAYYKGNYKFEDDNASSHYLGCREANLTIYISRKKFGFFGIDAYVDIDGLYYYATSGEISTQRDIYVTYYVGNTRVDFETHDSKVDSEFKSMLQLSISEFLLDKENTKQANAKYLQIMKDAWFS